MKLAVIGAGNGGHAMAAHLTAEGHEVALFSRTRAKLDAIEAQGGVGLNGLGHDAVVPLAGATTDMAEARAGAALAIRTVTWMVQRE
jgi:opine dehydrogenase